MNQKRGSHFPLKPVGLKMREEREAGKWQTFQSTLRPLVKLRTQPGSLISAFYEFCHWKSFPTFRISYKSNFVAARDLKKKTASTHVFSSQGFHGPPAPNSVLSSLIKKFLEREKERQGEGTAVKKSWVCTPREEGGRGTEEGKWDAMICVSAFQRPIS